MPKELKDRIFAKAHEDSSFRKQLLADPKVAIEETFGIKLSRDHELWVHDETYSTTHLVLPPLDKFSEAERAEARAGVGSIEFLRNTLYDPAPPLRIDEGQLPPETIAETTESLISSARKSIRRALDFVATTLDDNGAWHCIRFNIADPNIPRHFERPAFVSAMCLLALECSNENRAKAICAQSKTYIEHCMEYPGLWRYYRHLPNDLDSTTMCSLVIDTHPWVLFRRNMPAILNNRNQDGLFMTWLHDEAEPDVTALLRIEADPVVNANVIAYLGDRPETKNAQEWLKESIKNNSLADASKWYPNPISAYYAISRAMVRSQGALLEMRTDLTDQVLDLCDEEAGFGNVLQTSQVVSTLYNIGNLEKIDLRRQLATIIGLQREDGSWSELLAFGDQNLSWGIVGQFGHGSEAVTTAFCIEALERLIKTCKV